MIRINGKVFLNIQEAVGWLMANNALPFQCTANYAADTEIPLSDIVNPSPAKLRIGSIIFFADAKAATVTGITDNSFTVGSDYIDLDQNPHVTNVAIDAYGHLITTLSDGSTVDAGLIKQVSGFSISASQHLIASFNDGTTQDLGAIFAGDITISGTLRATKVEQSQPNFTADIALVAEPASHFSVSSNLSKVEEINGVLYITIKGCIDNITNDFQGDLVIHALIELPHSVALKVLDAKGNMAASSSSDDVIYGSKMAYWLVTENDFSEISGFIRNDNSPDKISFTTDPLSGIGIDTWDRAQFAWTAAIPLI